MTGSRGRAAIRSVGVIADVARVLGGSGDAAEDFATEIEVQLRSYAVLANGRRVEVPASEGGAIWLGGQAPEAPSAPSASGWERERLTALRQTVDRVLFGFERSPLPAEVRWATLVRELRARGIDVSHEDIDSFELSVELSPSLRAAIGAWAKRRQDRPDR